MHWLYELAHGASAWQKLAFALIMVFAFFAVIGVLLVVIDHTPRKGREKWQAFYFLLPAIILLSAGLIGPIFKTAVSALTAPAIQQPDCLPQIEKCGTTGGGWNNFENFRWAFTNSDALQALAHTLEWTLITPICATGIGLVYAYAIDKIRGEALAKALIFLPTAISFVGAAVIWKLMYQSKTQQQAPGLVNEVLGWVGLGPIGFPTNGGFQLTVWMIIVMIWIQAGFATVVLSAAIKAVPAEIVEAAEIDGATQGQAFRRVVIPQIRPTLIVVLVTISIATLKVFDLVRTFAADKYDGDTLANLMYTSFQQSGDNPILANRSAALAMVIFLLVIPFVAYQVRQMVNQRAGR